MSKVTTRFLREGRGLPPELEQARVEIKALCESYGLDFFDTIFEMCTYEEINMIAAYGGFPHALPALALWHGLPRDAKVVRVRLIEDLRDGD